MSHNGQQLQDVRRLLKRFKKLLPKFDQFSEQGLTTWRSSNQNWSSELKIYNNNINLKEVQFGIIV